MLNNTIVKVADLQPHYFQKALDFLQVRTYFAKIPIHYGRITIQSRPLLLIFRD